MENLSLEKLNIKDANFFKKSVFFFFGFILILIGTYFLFFTAPNKFPVNIPINIKEGSSLRSISKYLEENNVIRSRPLFETFVIMYGGDKNIGLGDYQFEKKLPVFEVARRIAKGERNISTVKITIPEGFNNDEIAQNISLKLPNFNKENFLIKAKEKEGYLFPDTYFFFATDSEEEVLTAMSENFNKKILAVEPQVKNSNKTENEIITMASIIEKESKGDYDRELISGILWKRILIRMPLQVDAAPSTYKNKGLPERPIANPGMKAIEAALHPMNSNYLYYLHDKDGNIHFALTFKEHKLNKQRYLKNT